MKSIVSIKMKLVDEDRILTKTDKGNTIIVFYKLDYIEKVDTYIHTQQYTFPHREFFFAKQI